MNLANNKLAIIPSKIQELIFLQMVWIGGNPFDCHCSMTWMVGWLNNFTRKTGEHVIRDYKDVMCHSGLNIGDPIYKLDEVSMGCFPSKWSLFQKVGVGIGAAVAVVIITVLVIISIRNSRSLRFFIFHKLKIRSALYWNADKEDDNLENIKYDAYLTYRYNGFVLKRFISLKDQKSIDRRQTSNTKIRFFVQSTVPTVFKIMSIG